MTNLAATLQTADKLAGAILSAAIGVNFNPYPPERIDMPKKEFDNIRELALKYAQVRIKFAAEG